MDQAFTNDQIRTLPEEEAGVVILGGEPYMNVNGRYVLEAEALVIFQDRKVRFEIEKLKRMEKAFNVKAEELREANKPAQLPSEEAEKLIEEAK